MVVGIEVEISPIYDASTFGENTAGDDAHVLARRQRDRLRESDAAAAAAARGTSTARGLGPVSLRQQQQQPSTTPGAAGLRGKVPRRTRAPARAPADVAGVLGLRAGLAPGGGQHAAVPGRVHGGRLLGHVVPAGVSRRAGDGGYHGYVE